MRDGRHLGVDAVRLIVKNKISDQVQRYLRGKIVKGEIPEGARLVEVEISAELGVSRTPVREALWHLSSMHLVRRLANGGYEVGNVRRELVDILDIRAALECHAARKAAEAIDDAQIADILVQKAVPQGAKEDIALWTG
jgi:DNA-binding GntR family transcriptional regulator